MTMPPSNTPAEPPANGPGAVPVDAAASDPAAFDPAAFAQWQLDAYNARDLERFVAAYTDDVTVYRWPDPQPFLVGRAALAEHYRTKRFHLPDLHAALLNRMVIGRTVIDHERVTGVGPEPLNVAALYDVTPAGIQRVCFFSGT